MGGPKYAWSPPPPNVDHWPSQNSGPAVKISAKLLLNTLRYANFQKILACGGLIRVELIPLQILSFKAKDSEQIPLPCNILLTFLYVYCNILLMF